MEKNMFYSILKESGYFQFKDVHNHPITKRYELVKSNVGFAFFVAFSPLLMSLGLFTNSILFGLIGLGLLGIFPLYMYYTKKQSITLKKYLKENVLDYFKNENNLVILYEEIRKDPHFDKVLLEHEIKLLIGSLEDGHFENSLMYLLDKWKRKKDEAVIEEKKHNRYQNFLEKISGKDKANKKEITGYEEYL